jgi:membrane protein
VAGYRRMGRSSFKRRVISAVKRNKPVLGAGLALAATYALTVAMESSAQERPARKAPPPLTPPRKLHPAAGLSGWPFWKAILLRVYESTTEDRLLALAAGAAFYGLLALFPGITALVSSYALFTDPRSIGDHMNSLASLMPAGGFGIVQEQVVRILSHATGGLSFAFTFGLLLAVWSANAGMKAMIDALNAAYGVPERRNIVSLNAVSLAMTVAAIAGMLLAFAAIVVLPVMLAYLPFDGGALLVKWLRWPALGVLLLLALAALYRFGPDLEHPRWHWITPGALFAALAWLAGSALLSYYLANFADYDATYGSLGAGIGLLTWLWMSAIVVLMGGELNAELDAAAADTHELAERSKIT